MWLNRSNGKIDCAKHICKTPSSLLNLVKNRKYFSIGVLWSGAFVGWLGHLTRWKIFLFVWTDCKLGYFLYRFGGHYSSILLTAMSIEKLFALYFPLKAKSYCTVGTAKWVTSILALIIAGLNFPMLIFYKFNGKLCVISKHSVLVSHDGHNVIFSGSYYQ